MKIDIVIANPPYDTKYECLCQKIDTALKKIELDRWITIHPIYRTTTYKTAEFVENPFKDYNSKSPNLFIMDMKGNTNEYMSLKKAWFWQPKSGYTLYARWNYNFCIIPDEKMNFSIGGRGTVSKDFPQDFLEWLQTNETAQWFRKTFFHLYTKTACVNKLWEIYNENRHSDSESTL